MISLWFEHYTIKTARRALLISSFVAILLPSLKIYGDGLEVLGLTFSFEHSSILTATRLVVAYFVWIFIWLNLAIFAESARTKIARHYEARIGIEKSAAEVAEREAFEPYEGPEHEQDPWWEHYDKTRAILTKHETLMTQPVRLIECAAVVFVEYAPPLALAGLAILVPEATNEFLFSIFNRNDQLGE